MDMNRSRGFTLIELLVVIAIIGILSSVVLVSLNVARMKGRDAKRLADIKELRTSLELYHDAHLAYPATIGDASASELVSGGYIGSLPLDPTTNAPYAYAGLDATGDGTCGGYHLGATLEETSSSVIASRAGAPADAAKCTGSLDDFDGTAEGVYDVKVSGQ